jgi:AcrR family transcriptional regulator
MGRPRIPTLSPDIIVNAALEVGGSTGQFTLRQIAQSLGVKQASLYNHVAGKAELIALMRDRIHEEMAVKLDVNAQWTDAVRLVANAHRQLLIGHPWLIPELAEAPAALGAAITTVENLATVLSRAGFEPVETRSIIGALDVIIIGASIDWFAPPELFPPDVLAGSTDLARAIRAAPRDDNRADAIFEYTLELFVEGLELRLSRA